MKKPWLEGMEIISQPMPAWGGWIETFGLTAIVLGVSFITQQNDPFRLGVGFPWPVLAPLLAGLRYGFIHGFASALAILAALGISLDQQWQVASELPLSFAIGVVIVAMVAGEFRDIWGRRLHRLEGAYQYRAERLEEFTRNYQLLRLSHDRLEQTVANSGLSLREGIMHLQSSLDSIDGTSDLPGPSLQRLIEFMAGYASLTRACIVGIRGNRVRANVLARVGEPFEIDESDPVLTGALETGELTAVNSMAGTSGGQRQLLVAIPLSDSTGEVHAMLLVKSMPFFAFHENNLKLIAVLAAHGIDHLRFGTAASSVARFIAAFDRVYQDHLTFKLDATLLRLSGNPPDVEAANGKLRSAIRAIDITCIACDNGKPVVWILLPLTDSVHAQAWMQRLDSVLAKMTAELFAIGEVDPQRIRSLSPQKSS
ncbi:MAG TPA: protein PelD [Nitrosospira sp.]|nr:protein PelD [Nitrosospira sp.]